MTTIVARGRGRADPVDLPNLLTEDPLSAESSNRGTATLRRALAVLEAFTSSRPRLTLAELAAVTRQDKATLLRHLDVFLTARLVERHGDTYSLGLGAFALGASYLAQHDVYAISRAPMEELAERLGETISLAIRDGSEVVYVEVVHGQAEIGVQSSVGVRQPAHTSALGKVLLAWLTPEEREASVYVHPMVRMTSHTITSPGELEAHLEAVRRDGYAMDNEERAEGIRCVATPIWDRTGRVTAALSVSGASFRMVGEHLEDSREACVAATRLMSLRLGANVEDLLHAGPASE
jgi:DNA-binding IclR family transcriptional regulator